MNYTLAKQLKEAGFPWNPGECGHCKTYWNDPIWYPTLSELIEACGDKFWGLSRTTLYSNPENQFWRASSIPEKDREQEIRTRGKTPEEAVANLWLELKERSMNDTT